MNAEKAKEYFSAYYENALEPGLAQALERKFAADARLRDEYEAFKATMASLEVLSRPVPEPDFDLHERITARLDRHLWEKNRNEKPRFAQWWRSLALGGLATVAVVAALMQLNSRSPVNEAKLTTLPVDSVTGKIQLQQSDLGLTLQYVASGAKKVEILDDEGKVLESSALNGDTLRSALTNNRDEAVLLQVNVQSDSPTWVAVPGKQFAHRMEGQGTLKDFVLAVADHFRVPVAVHSVDLQKATSWKFSSTNEFESVEDALDGDVSVEQIKGVIWIVGQ